MASKCLRRPLRSRTPDLPKPEPGVDVDHPSFGGRAKSAGAAHGRTPRRKPRRHAEPGRARYLAWFDVKRARLWQSVICVGVVAVMGVILGLLIWAVL